MQQGAEVLAEQHDQQQPQKREGVHHPPTAGQASCGGSPGVNFCRPFWMAAMPLDADTSVVITASDATKVLEFSFMLVIRLAMVSRMTGISGKKRKNSSTTLSTVKPGRVLTTTSSHISSGKNAVSRKSVACPA